jgi:hypothetical protein
VQLLRFLQAGSYYHTCVEEVGGLPVGCFAILTVLNVPCGEWVKVFGSDTRRHRLTLQKSVLITHIGGLHALAGGTQTNDRRLTDIPGLRVIPLGEYGTG